MKKRIRLSESNLRQVIREAILDELDWRTEQNAIDQRRARDIDPLIKRSGDSTLSDEQKAKDSQMIKKLLARERDLQDMQREHDQEQMTDMGLNGYERNQRKHNFRHKKAYFDKKLGKWIDPDDNENDYVKADAEAFWRANGVKENKLRQAIKEAILKEGQALDEYYLSDLIVHSAYYGMPSLTPEDIVEYLDKVIPQDIKDNIIDGVIHYEDDGSLNLHKVETFNELINQGEDADTIIDITEDSIDSDYREELFKGIVNEFGGTFEDDEEEEEEDDDEPRVNSLQDAADYIDAQKIVDALEQYLSTDQRNELIDDIIDEWNSLTVSGEDFNRDDFQYLEDFSEYCRPIDILQHADNYFGTWTTGGMAQDIVHTLWWNPF